jgi:hypothetical protein
MTAHHPERTPAQVRSVRFNPLGQPAYRLPTVPAAPLRPRRNWTRDWHPNLAPDPAGPPGMIGLRRPKTARKPELRALAGRAGTAPKRMSRSPRSTAPAPLRARSRGAGGSRWQRRRPGHPHPRSAAPAGGPALRHGGVDDPPGVRSSRPAGGGTGTYGTEDCAPEAGRSIHRISHPFLVCAAL